ncbi:MAG: nucleotidyltransferase domain-containing protein [Actinomycetota bacterium]
MRFHETVEDVLGSSTKIRVLRLFCRTGGSHTGREIARLIDRYPDTTNRALNSLERQGILKRDYAGPSHIYSLNKDHLLVKKAIVRLFDVEQNALLYISKVFMDQLAEDFLKAVIFGSVAKKRERPNSDIDVLIIVQDSVDLEDIDEKINEATVLSTFATGNPVMPLVEHISTYEKKKKAKKKEGFWKDIFDTKETITYTRDYIEDYGQEGL